MSRISCRALALAAACLAAMPGAVSAQPLQPANAVPPGVPNSNIFDPSHAPIIVIRIGAHRLVLVPRNVGGAQVLHLNATSNKADQGFAHLITSSIAGAVAAPSGEFHVRGSHGQYTYYLDGAPLPESVSGSFSDLIDPKNIETLRVLTGGFPAQYGNNLAAVFDVTARAGQPGRPRGFAEQLLSGYRTSQSTVQFGGGAARLQYYLSGVRNFTNRRLDSVTQDPRHDAGADSVVFGKFDYEAGPSDRIILDAARTDAYLQLPNDESQQAIGRDVTQREDGDFANLIWRHTQGLNGVTVALYSHQSRLRYTGDPAHDLADASAASADGGTPANLPSSAFEDRYANYIGLRTDAIARVSARHRVGYGFDISTVTGAERFTLLNAVDNGDGTTGVQTVLDAHGLSGGDRAAYVQDDWTPGRFLVNYGVRYDIHKTDTTTSQLSPRLNLTYALNGRDKVHAYYDRLFQPAPIEDIRRLDPNAVAFKPERDNFYEIGYAHENGGITTSLSAYYKTVQDVIDENIIAGTQIREPFNVQKGYVRGIELAVDGSLTRDLSFYANYARSWARAAGDFTGGLVPAGAPPGYFYEDHDQTHTASVGLAYARRGQTVSLDGEYGSGFPYGQSDVGLPNFYRVPAHFIFNLEIGSQIGRGRLALSALNVLNHGYVIKQASPFSDREWGQGRTLGVKWTQNF
jgi:hypothetical protein